MRGTNSVSRLIECMLVTPFDRYLEQVKKNKINLSLKKLDLEHYGEKSTADAKMLVNAEDAASREQLQELVRKESRASGGASAKRNPNSTPLTKNQKKKARAAAPKSYASAKDSNSGTNVSRRRGGTQKTKKNSTCSGTGSRK